MKKLTKQNLETMAAILCPLTEAEQRSTLGGCNCSPDSEYCPNSGACFDSGLWVNGSFIGETFPSPTGCCDTTGCMCNAPTGSATTVTGGIFIVDVNGNFSYVGGADRLIIAVGSIDSGNIFYGNAGTELTIQDNKSYLQGNGGVELFKNLADNTKVEWGLATNSQTGDFVLTTSHNPTAIEKPMMGNGDGWDTYYHNHCAGPEPSQKDQQAVGNMPPDSTYKYFNIYYEQDRNIYTYQRP